MKKMNKRMEEMQEKISRLEKEVRALSFSHDLNFDKTVVDIDAERIINDYRIAYFFSNEDRPVPIKFEYLRRGTGEVVEVTYNLKNNYDYSYTTLIGLCNSIKIHESNSDEALVTVDGRWFKLDKLNASVMEIPAPYKFHKEKQK